MIETYAVGSGVGELSVALKFSLGPLVLRMTGIDADDIAKAAYEGRSKSAAQTAAVMQVIIMIGTFALNFVPVIGILMDLKEGFELIWDGFQQLFEGIGKGDPLKLFAGLGLIALGVISVPTGTGSEINKGRRIRQMTQKAQNALDEKGLIHYTKDGAVINNRLEILESTTPSYYDFNTSLKGLMNIDGVQLHTHHGIPQYVMKMQDVPFEETRMVPGYLATDEEHYRIFHKVIRKYLPEKTDDIYDWDDIDDGLYWSYSEINRMDIYRDIEPYIMKFKAISRRSKRYGLCNMAKSELSVAMDDREGEKKRRRVYEYRNREANIKSRIEPNRKPDRVPVAERHEKLRVPLCIVGEVFVGATRRCSNSTFSKMFVRRWMRL